MHGICGDLATYFFARLIGIGLETLEKVQTLEGEEALMAVETFQNLRPNAKSHRTSAVHIVAKGRKIY